MYVHLKSSVKAKQTVRKFFFLVEFSCWRLVGLNSVVFLMIFENLAMIL